MLKAGPLHWIPLLNGGGFLAFALTHIDGGTGFSMDMTPLMLLATDINST